MRWRGVANNLDFSSSCANGDQNRHFKSESENGFMNNYKKPLLPFLLPVLGSDDS